MATTIDIENAKQIRQPMDVLIEMNVPDTTVTLTFSGYSPTAKVADGALGQQAWPMRGLADLQSRGFPLDGSRVLYDSSTSASETNGKLGVRGNVGQTVNVTVTGSTTIRNLTVFATGATSVTYNGTTSAIVGGQAVIPVDATSVTLTFNPAYDDQRVEVSDIIAGTVLRITNENLIRAVVSLRSDLSIINPTLPESELNVEVYNDADISETVASLPEDTPITYSAGYKGDMSPTRKFYVTGQVTWADNVLSIQAVDAVHFLDYETPAFLCGWAGRTTISALLFYLQAGLEGLLPNFEKDTDKGPILFCDYNAQKGGLIIPEGLSIREIIAHTANLFRWNYVSPNYFTTYAPTGLSKFKYDYVDAGRPTVRMITDPPSWTLYESDFADVKSQIDREVRSFNYTYYTATGGVGSLDIGDGVPCGSATWRKNLGATVSIDENCYAFTIGLPRSQMGEQGSGVTAVIPAISNGGDSTAWPTPTAPFGALWSAFHVGPVMGPSTKNGQTMSESSSLGRGSVLTQFVPWSVVCKWGTVPYTQASQWTKLVNRGVISRTAEEFNLNVYGFKSEVAEYSGTVSASKSGIEADITTLLKGTFYFANRSGTTASEAYPKSGLTQLLNRSNKTGTFTWKGDPRMQPRDNATITMRDGTQKVVTLENITLTHERGGLSAEITYREGAV